MIEIEIKAHSNKKIEQKIKEKAKFKKEKTQSDFYYNHPNRDFGKTDEALRLRKENKKTYITYKGPKINEKTKTRKEIEEEVESYEKSKKILELLGFEITGKVQKKRQIYELNNYQITIDKVNDLGRFIELEKKSKQYNKEMIDKAINFLKKLGIKEKDFEKKSYLELLLEKNKRN